MRSMNLTPYSGALSCLAQTTGGLPQLRGLRGPGCAGMAHHTRSSTIPLRCPIWPTRARFWSFPAASSFSAASSSVRTRPHAISSQRRSPRREQVRHTPISLVGRPSAPGMPHSGGARRQPRPEPSLSASRPAHASRLRLVVVDEADRRPRAAEPFARAYIDAHLLLAIEHYEVQDLAPATTAARQSRSVMINYVRSTRPCHHPARQVAAQTALESPKPQVAGLPARSRSSDSGRTQDPINFAVVEFTRVILLRMDDENEQLLNSLRPTRFPPRRQCATPGSNGLPQARGMH